MPELPEVETIRRTLESLILNKTIENIDIFYPKMMLPEPDVFFQLKGQMLHRIDRRGKYLIFVFQKDTFISHLRMEGKYFYYQQATPPLKHTHVVFTFSDGSQLHYNDTRKFGRMQLSDMNYLNEEPLNQLGKEPFEITVEELTKAFKNNNGYLKEMLLDQHIILGIGNIYANEICFEMGLHPKTRVKNLSKRKIARLIEVSIGVLNDAIAMGGTTIHTFNANGIDGLFQIRLKVHGRENQPCITCGEPIRKIRVGGRGTYYCPKCQNKRK